MGLSRDTMIDRMLASDASYDGRFITGVLSTGIYCLPSCRARKPKPENVRFFPRPEDAEAAGLRACKRCRPRDFYRGDDPDEALVEGLLARLRADPAAFRNVEEMAAVSGVGSSKLHELFRAYHHTTPAELLARERIAHARRALLASDRPVTDVAFEAGFETLSAFHQNFRKHSRMTPGDYRRLREAASFEVELPRRFDAARILAYHGRDPESALEKASGRSLAFGAHLGGRPARLEIELDGRRGRCRAEALGPSDDSLGAEAHRLSLRLLGLAIDPAPFERRARGSELVARLIDGRRGLSPPQTSDVFSGLVWVIAGQQVSLPVAFSLRRRLARALGVPLGGGLHAPPAARRVAEMEPPELRRLGFSQRKAEYLTGVARLAAGDGRGDGKDDRQGEGLDLEALGRLPAPRVERTLLGVRGLGPWSVNYLMMRSLGLADCVPVGDAGLVRSLRSFFELEERPDAERTRALLAPFAPHRSLATFHFWSRLEEEP